MNNNYEMQAPDRRKIVTLGIALFIVIAALSVLRYSWRSISPGYVGIVFDKANHSVTAKRLEPGWAFINPLTQAIQEYPVTIRTYGMLQRVNEGAVRGDDSIKVQSNEGQQLNLDVVIQYQVIKQEAAELYQDWGGAPIDRVEDGIVRQYTRSMVPVIASRYGWEEVTSSKRGEVTSEVVKALEPEMKRRHIQLVSFGIREVHLPGPLQSALDQKIQAQQGAEQQQYQLKRAEIKAKQDVTEAGGRGNAMKTEAEGEAAAILTRATAQSEANKKLAQTITPELVRYQLLQRWDGKLPTFSGGALPLIDASSILAGPGK